MHIFRCIQCMSWRSIPVWGSALFLIVGLTACSAMQPVPGQALTPAPHAMEAHEKRLKVLEADMQRLVVQLDALQETSRHAGNGWRMADTSFDQMPAEARPVTPAIALSAGPLQKIQVPTPAVAPAPVRKAAPEPIRKSTPPTAPQHRPGQDEWVINLASYTNESFAAKKLTEFAGEGVVAEQVQARVKGKTIYRLRVPGFGSFRAASVEAGTIQTKLNLESTWIARR